MLGSNTGSRRKSNLTPLKSPCRLGAEQLLVGENESSRKEREMKREKERERGEVSQSRIRKRSPDNFNKTSIIPAVLLGPSINMDPGSSGFLAASSLQGWALLGLLWDCSLTSGSLRGPLRITGTPAPPPSRGLGGL